MGTVVVDGVEGNKKETEGEVGENETTGIALKSLGFNRVTKLEGNTPTFPLHTPFHHPIVLIIIIGMKISNCYSYFRVVIYETLRYPIRYLLLHSEIYTSFMIMRIPESSLSST